MLNTSIAVCVHCHHPSCHRDHSFQSVRTNTPFTLALAQFRCENHKNWAWTSFVVYLVPFTLAQV